VQEEEKNTDIRRKLKNLPRVEASGDFENKLLRRINALTAEESTSKHKTGERKGFFEAIFGKPRSAWFIPALSAGALAVIALTVTLYMSGNNTAKQDGKQETAYTQSSSDDSGLRNSQDGTNPGAKNDEGIPGKNIANDLETGRAGKLEQPSEINRGLLEQEAIPAPKQSDKFKNTEPVKNSQPLREAQDVKTRINVETGNKDVYVPTKDGGNTPKNDNGNIQKSEEKRAGDNFSKEAPVKEAPVKEAPVKEAPVKEKATSPPPALPSPSLPTKGFNEQEKAKDNSREKNDENPKEIPKDRLKDTNKDASKDKKKDVKKEEPKKPPVEKKREEPKKPPVDIRKEEPKKPPVEKKREEPKKPPVDIKKTEPEKPKEKVNE